MASTEQYTDSIVTNISRRVVPGVVSFNFNVNDHWFAYTVSRRITKQEVNTVELLGYFTEAFELLIVRKRTLTI